MVNRKQRKIFVLSFIGAILLSCVVFFVLNHYMNNRIGGAIKEIKSTYVTTLSGQFQQKFYTLRDMRLEQVTAMIERIEQKEKEEKEFGTNKAEKKEYLGEMARINQISVLGLIDEEGNYESIYGSSAIEVRPIDFKGMLDQEGYVVCYGEKPFSTEWLLFGKRYECPMNNGNQSILLVAGTSVAYVSNLLLLEHTSDEDALYSHIVDSNGVFVINHDEGSENIYSHLRERYADFGESELERYERDMHRLLSEDFRDTIIISRQEKEIDMYCAKLEDSLDWYIVTVLDTDKLEKPISELNDVRMLSTLSAALIVLSGMCVVISIYYRMLKKQMGKLEKARQAAEIANQAKSDFLSSISHDIRTPMNVIVGMTEIAMKNTQDVKRVEDCMQKIRLSSKHLLSLINDVLDMSKIESGKMALEMESMSLRECLDDIVNIIKSQVKERSQYFDIYIQKILTEYVYCDSVRLSQVIMNLLSNAVKFTPQGGRIDVYVCQEPSPEGEEYVRTRFRIVDTGIGMSEEFQKNIWETFSREKKDQVKHTSGTGLGTAISKRIVDMMGGTIEVKSELNKGSEFIITLDLKRDDTNGGEMKLPAWDILVVDDNELLCTSAAENLKELGVHAEWTVDGREAIRMIKERRDSGKEYDFVLIDWQMPDVDSAQIIQEIREEIDSELPLFLISAYDWSDMEDEIVASGIKGFISKPLFKSTLYHHLSKYMDEKDSEPKQSYEAEKLNLAGKRILLAEDIDLNWEIAYELLSDFGLMLDRAVNGKECVEMFQQSAVGYYDAILTDIRMPVMDGYEAVKEIRALPREDKNLPIIAMTADAFSDDAQKCIECGMDAHIPKPLDIKECVRILQNFFGGGKRPKGIRA